MTAIIREPIAPRSGPLSRVWDRARGGTDEPAWVIPAFVGVISLAGVLYIWNLTVSGYANAYYSAAALAASQSWSAFFFGSFDAANFITIDKPPVATWVMGLSVRAFGLSSWSILLPQALAGVATVGVLFMAVRRSFGPAAAVIAALVMALTPAAVLMFRFNNPDAVLTFLLVTAAWALLQAIHDGRYRWVVAAGTLVGFAFLTKYLQAYLVLPGFAFVYALSANTTVRRRIVGLLVAVATVLVTSGWWVAIVELIPPGVRPFIGGSTTGSALDLIFGYDGLGRLFGASGPAGRGGGAGFGGEAGLFRLFNDDWFGEIAWFIPLALAGLWLGLWLRRRRPRIDRGLAGYVLWGSWFATTALVFSFMSGVVHSYYAVALAPAIAALVGASVVDLWGLRSRTWFGGIFMGMALIGSAVFGWWLLGRTPEFAPIIGPLAVTLAASAAGVLVLTSVPRWRDALRRVAGAAAAVGLCAVVLAPASYAAATIGVAYSGGDPHPGPTVAGVGFGGGPRGVAGTMPDDGYPPPMSGAPPTRPERGSATAGPPGGGASADSALVDYLVANQGSATWIVAANSANEAGSIQLASGLPVMAMGGFTGSDPAPTLDELKSYIASGELRYVLTDRGGGGFGGQDGATTSDRRAWVTSACTVVDYDGSGSSSLYDCAGAGS
ncbi:MAG: glycosyl transferase [Chloroflexi bacterium CSP1-4]|nr:MAG: glycosyl transferase [Chloroflexi bacterium CSP1-4]